MNIKEAILLGNKKIKDKNIEDSNLKVKMILMDILNVSKEYFTIHEDEVLSDKDLKEFESKISRLEKNEPIQYILNKQFFYGLEFYVDKNVLIPQPDTEIIVEECINLLTNVENNPQHSLNKNKKALRILDLCTGSGAIGVSIGKNISNIEVCASDISEKALEIARKNAINNDVKIRIIQSDLFENIKEKFDIIVSNPPYIETSTIENLSEEVKKEPIIALDGGEDGLTFYRKIATESKFFLRENGYLVLEIGFNQKEAVTQILKQNNFKNIYLKKDLGGNDRMIVAQNN